MRIACIYSLESYTSVVRPLPHWNYFPFGLSMIAAVLERAGHTVECWVICPGSDLSAVADDILVRFGAEVAACTAVSTQFPIIERFAKLLKQRSPALHTILGGHHATLASEAAIASPWIDTICVGEGDQAVVAYADALAAGRRPTGIPGLWVKDLETGEIEKTPPVPFYADLDSLPFVNRDHWSRWVNNPDRSSVIVLGRGCPFLCTYCSNHALKSVTTGKFVRFRSPDNVMAEIEQLAAALPELEYVYLEVETIGAIPRYAMELSERLAAFNAGRERPVRFGTNLSVTTRLVSDAQELERFLAALARGNITSVNIGLESGSERIRNEILKRPRYTNADIIAFCQAARRHGINVHLFVLLGLPTETPAEFAETAAVARDCQPADLFLSIFYPYPGTDLYRMAREMNLFDPSRIRPTAERSRAYLDLPGFPKWRIMLEYSIFYYRVYRGRWPMTRILAYSVRQVLNCVPALVSLFRFAVDRSPLLRQVRRILKARIAAPAA
ncbi:B12-binding domain-containing radical SAM protein [Azospirillum sp.]|uniref:B12-binding domain-containing radical SAM protein n=1 Tax=Azospirillum sp. TaxID=34012 RepID=UPI002D688022|nr:radical SAM protein [Azospirillum sp.]HYD68801.1 radical SAM protein [Azospirillum sp.]